MSSPADRPILTVTLNAAIDVSWVIGRLAPGGVTYVDRTEAAPGGKGNNVARVLATLGRPVIASGFVGGHTGARIVAGLRDAGIEPAFVEIADESRMCLAIVESESGQITEVRERGAEVCEAAATQLLAQLPETARKRNVEAVVMSGGLPPGLPADFYSRITESLTTVVPFISLDSSGEALNGGLGPVVDLIAPNASEIAWLMDRSADAPPTLQEMITFAQSILIGTRLAPTSRVLLSLGANGAALISASDTLIARPPTIDVVSTVGCGDALLAGLVDAHCRGESDEDALIYAVAVGSAAAIQQATGVIDLADVERLRTQINVERLG